MKEFKKYFFETLIQLAILANVFRENGRYSIHDAVSSSNGRSYLGRVFQTIELNSTRGNSDYLFLNENISNDRYSQYSQDLDVRDFNSSDFSMENSNYINKETDAHINDIRFLRRLNSRSSNTNSHNHVGNMNNFLFVAPASFSYNNNNQKELNRLSETRLLFNSIEQQQQSNNQFNKEVYNVNNVIIFLVLNLKITYERFEFLLFFFIYLFKCQINFQIWISLGFFKKYRIYLMLVYIKFYFFLNISFFHF